MTEVSCPKCGAKLDAAAQCPQCAGLLSEDHFFLNFQPIIQNHFKLLKVLGRGGMGEIYLADDLRLKRKVAIKRISRKALANPEARLRFQREAQAASQLDHPNICTIYEIAEENGEEFIVMQFVDGVTLEQLLKIRSLSLTKILAIASQIADGLAEAHRQGIVHRDLKPSNIMLDSNGRVKILDFGIAKVDRSTAASSTTTKQELTEKGLVLGTVSYLSPEQATGQAVDGRSDIFSFGILLYEMVEGLNPFLGKDNITTLYNILNKVISFSERTPFCLQEIIERALQKEVEQRYADFQSVQADLSACEQEYARAQNAAPAGTEVLDRQEKAKMLAEMQGVETIPSDENLADMVLQIRRMKASTETQVSTKRRLLRLFPPVIVLALAVMLVLIWKSTKKVTLPQIQKYITVLVKKFQNQTAEAKLTDEILYLVSESLNQFPELRLLDEETLSEMVAMPRTPAMPAVDFTLTGTLSHAGDKINIEANFFSADGRIHPPPFFIPGKERNSILTDQVDNLSRRIYLTIFPGKGESEVLIKSLANIYGSNWPAFEKLYAGIQNWQHKEFSAALQEIGAAENESPQMLLSRYYLALIYDYIWPRVEALNHMQRLIPEISQLTDPQKWHALALQAKLFFNIADQIIYLKKLQEKFPFAKEIIYDTGEAYFHEGNAERAMAEYLQALRLDNRYSPALNRMGYCLAYLGSHRQAIEYFERYRNIDRTANSFDSLGDGYFFKGDYIQAENNKIYAVSLDNTMNWPYQTIANIYILRADYQGAEKALATYERISPNAKAKADAQAARAFICYNNQQYAAARQLAEQAIALFESSDITENSAEYHWLRGLAMIELRDISGAKNELHWLREIKERYHLSPDNYETSYKFYLHLAALLAEKEEKYDEMSLLFSRLLAMKTQLSYWISYYHYPFFLSEYAKCLLRTSDLKGTSDALQTCLNFNPAYVPALWVKVQLLRRQNDPAWKSVCQQIAKIYGSLDENNYWKNTLRTLLRETASK